MKTFCEAFSYDNGIEKGGGRKSRGWDEWQQQGIMRLWMGVWYVREREEGKFNLAESTGCCVRNFLRNLPYWSNYINWYGRNDVEDEV